MTSAVFERPNVAWALIFSDCDLCGTVNIVSHAHVIKEHIHYIVCDTCLDRIYKEFENQAEKEAKQNG